MRFTTYTVAGALAALATAQTVTDCNPMEKDCPNDPAMPQTFETNFKAGKDAVKGWKQTTGSLVYGADGAAFTITKKGEGPTIQSEGFLHFGRVEVKMKAAPGQGIISSIVLQSQDLDEVDWEWIGGQDGKVQMNYFGKGNTTTYDRMIEKPVAATQTEMHTYVLDWKPESLTWIVDDKPMRTLKYADANGGRSYPQTPCNVRIGNWAGGDSKDQGTIDWAGGVTDYSKAPFTMTVESVKVTNYNPGTEYKWSDKTGSKESIQVIGAGNKDGAPQNSAVIQPSATGSAAPIESVINAPSATGGSKPANGTISHSGGIAKPSGSVNGSTPHTDGKPCECGTATVTVTGPPPAATITNKYSAINPTDIISSLKASSVSTAKSAGSTQPPYPTSGLMVETRPAPVVPNPVAPTGVIPMPTPAGNATTGVPAQFTGAASHNKAGVLVGAVAGVVLLAF